MLPRQEFAMFFAFIPLRKELIFVAVTLGKLKIIHEDGC